MSAIHFDRGPLKVTFLQLAATSAVLAQIPCFRYPASEKNTAEHFAESLIGRGGKTQSSFRRFQSSRLQTSTVTCYGGRTVKYDYNFLDFNQRQFKQIEAIIRRNDLKESTEDIFYAVAHWIAAGHNR